MKEKEKSKAKGWFQRFGLLLAGIFYLVSIIAVYLNVCGRELLDTSVKTMTFAHWQLEDGFREGYNEAIRQFTEYKAKQGQKVRIIQTTVPWRGYQQWFLTQLIGGTPADMVELNCTSEQKNQYFIPLSPYIGKPNPFNKGTPFESVPWKDTFLDNMNAALDINYGEYYGIGMSSSVYRVYVNMDILEKATGSRKLPETLSEWLDDCEKLKEYGKKIGKPIIPIGVRGCDKGTLNYLFECYFTQMNSNFHDDISAACYPLIWAVQGGEILDAVASKKVPMDKLLAAVDITKEIGKYFCEGFMSTDLEQTKFLFFAGKVGFFPEGSWNAYSIVKNTPFEVAIMEIPVIGKDSKYSKYFIGRPTEQGLNVGGQFGIPKTSKNFDLAMEFLQFTTSWKINQMINVDYCKWLPAVKKAEYKGILKYCEPQIGSGRKRVIPPFSAIDSVLGTHRKYLETLETIIMEDKENPQAFFWKKFIERAPLQIEECHEAVLSFQRGFLSIERQRQAFALSEMRPGISAADKQRTDIRYELMMEKVVSSYWYMDLYQKQIAVLQKLQKSEDK